MDALQILEQDHRKVKILFREVKDANDSSKKKELFDKIDGELETHTHIEETVFYPAIEKKEALKELVAEALHEHKEAKTLIKELEDLVAEDDEFDSKFAELIEAVEHHVEEEEYVAKHFRPWRFEPGCEGFVFGWLKIEVDHKRVGSRQCGNPQQEQSKKSGR